MEVVKQYRTLVLSDLHLGSKGSKAREATDFLKQHRCQTLLLNGDIIDGWQLKKYGNSWKKRHTAFFRQVLRHIERHNTQVIYLRGNHDDFLDAVLPLRIGKHFSIRRDYVLNTQSGVPYYVTHGDIFDKITTHLRWLAFLGDVGYNLLLGINKTYNQWRAWRGLPYYSLSQEIKHRVKSAVNYISDFEEKLAELARSKDCGGVICGHIHQPADRHIGGIHYLNSGDWVESLTALAEDYEGRWHLLRYVQAGLREEQELLPEELPDDETEETTPPEELLESVLSLSRLP